MDQQQFEVGAMVTYLCYVFLPLIIGGIHLCFKKECPWPTRAKIMLSYYTLISVGLQGVIVGSMQLFNAEQVAHYVRWPYSPFLLLLGVANLVFGLLGLSAWWIKGTWRAAAAAGFGLFLLFSAFLHLYDAFFHRNWSVGNLGPALWSSLLVPVALFGLLYVSLKKANHTK